MSSTNVNRVAHEASWHAAYPVPRSEAVEISQSELLAMMQDGQEPGKDFILVDLRKNDHAGGTIAGSLNLPAQSLYPSIPTLYTLFKAAGVSKVIWYCGSSKGRGNRAAAWFADYAAEQGNESVIIQSLALTKGIKGWVEAGSPYTARMSEFERDVWLK